MNKNYIIFGIVALGIVAWAAVSLAPTQKLGGAPLINYSVTNSSSTCGTSVATALAANGSVQFRSISNISTGTVYLWSSATSSGFSAPAGISVFGSGTITMSDYTGNLWKGTIFCLTSAGTSTLTYTQW